MERVITGHSTVMTWQDFVDYGEVNRAGARLRARSAEGRARRRSRRMMEFKLPEKLSAAGYTYAGGGRWRRRPGNMGSIGFFEELEGTA